MAFWHSWSIILFKMFILFSKICSRSLHTSQIFWVYDEFILQSSFICKNFVVEKISSTHFVFLWNLDFWNGYCSSSHIRNLLNFVHMKYLCSKKTTYICYDYYTFFDVSFLKIFRFLFGFHSFAIWNSL